MTPPRLFQNSELAFNQGRHSFSSNRGNCRFRIVVWLIFIFLCIGQPNHSCADNSPEAPFRVGFTKSMFTDVNENDARAAIKVWGKMIAEDQNVPTDPNPAILNNMNDLLLALQKKEVDAVGVTTTEYAQLTQSIRFSPIFVTYSGGSTTEQYVLLTHRKSPVKTLGDLDGRQLNVHANPRACLAPLWLDTLLAKEGHTSANHLTGKTVSLSKLSQAILPVFFRQADACLVTRSGFDTMAELNPQLARELVVLAESPVMVPAVFAFRADYQPSFKEKLFTGVNNLNKTPAGRQVLTIFQSENIEEQPPECLEPALTLITSHKQLVK